MQINNQIFFSAGEEYRAKKEIYSLMKRAASSLVVLDNYMDESIFDYVGSLDGVINVRLITSKRIPIFARLYQDFVKLHSNVEARENTDSHDRYIVIDGDEIWHLGASINHAGKKASMINKIIDPDEKANILKNINVWWSNGKEMVI